jgi:hypothetical protein
MNFSGHNRQSLRGAVALFCLLFTTGLTDPLITTTAEAAEPIAMLRSFGGVFDSSVQIAVPSFVLYDNGELLTVRQTADGEWDVFRATLTADQLAALRRRLQPSAQFLDLKRGYNLAPCFEDLPGMEVYLSGQAGRKLVRVEGLVVGAAHSSASCPQQQDKLPAEFMRYVAIMRDFQPARVEPWIPGSYRVFLTRWEKSGLPMPQPFEWPPTLPKLDRATAMSGSADYVLVVDGEGARTLKGILNKIQGTPVRIDGKLWGLTIEPEVPGSTRWENLR